MCELTALAAGQHCHRFDCHIWLKQTQTLCKIMLALRTDKNEKQGAALVTADGT